MAVLAGSITAAVLAAILLRIRNKHYRDLWEEQDRDTTQNTIPDTPERE